ncbi:MAG: hypothetical protein IIU68_00085 [Bacteroidales bacterium]|nr:hypothetical protein [Bacteroidales bacterium]
MQETQIYEIASRYTCTQATKYLNEPEQHAVDLLQPGHLGRRAVGVEKEIQDVTAVQHHFLDHLDLRIVTAPVQERAIVLVIDRIAGNVENLLLEFDEFIFELDLVHRTIVGLFCVLFHAAKIRHEDAKEWQDKNSAKKSD